MAITWNIDEARATVQAQMDEANRLDGVIDTIAAAWNIDEARATIRAQMAEANRLDEVIDDLSAETSAALARAEAAEAEAAECRAERAHYGDIMTSKLASAEAEIERLRSQVVTLEALWQRAIDADLLDDPHELGNAIADASALLNYPPPGDDD